VGLDADDQVSAGSEGIDGCHTQGRRAIDQDVAVLCIELFSRARASCAESVATEHAQSARRIAFKGRALGRLASETFFLHVRQALDLRTAFSTSATAALTIAEKNGSKVMPTVSIGSFLN
jgi:hypothetical protein